MTVRDFKVNDYAYGKHTITDTGWYVEHKHRFEINSSSILTRLIQEAGRYCEHYASDLFIDWKTVEETLETMEPGDSKIFLFGFRAFGVDHNAFVLAKAENESCYGTLQNIYRSLWRLDIDTGSDTDCCTDKITMKLGRVF